MTTQLTDRYASAVSLAAEAHRTQLRKATQIPYVAHVLAVSAIVLEDGGSEDEAIAGLLHDVAEDAGGQGALDEIAARFGERVATIVEACSDTLEAPKPPWRERKRAYLRHLLELDDEIIRVSLADKVHNARAIVLDLRAVGNDLWSRFNTGRAADQLWYYRSLADIFLELHPGALAAELDRLVGEMALLALGVDAQPEIRLWVDDDLVDRAAPDTWLHVTTAWEANALLGTGRVLELSLDHDLADDDANGRGVDVCDWLAYQQEALGRDQWPARIVLHTANPSGREAMARTIRRRQPGAREDLTSNGQPRFSIPRPERD